MSLVVLDTNVLVAGFRSRDGASFQLLTMLVNGASFRPLISVPLVLEYEMVLKRIEGLPSSEAERFVDFICTIGERREIYYLWRPALRDPKDEMILEVAVEGRAEAIITHNLRDFEGVESQFGIRVMTPGMFLLELRREGS